MTSDTLNDTAGSTALATFTFAVYPSDFGDRFAGFLIEVPTTGGENVAARRAWWSACAMLSERGVEPEDFAVCCWRDNRPGELVTSGGIVGYVEGGDDA